MMTIAEARAAFIRACESMEHAEPVALTLGAPIVVGGLRFRVDYDPRLDEVVLMLESEWRKKLTRARELAEGASGQSAQMRQAAQSGDRVVA